MAVQKFAMLCGWVASELRIQRDTSGDMAGATAAEIVHLLDLKPHPEGGFFRETFRDPLRVRGERAASTAIYFLLAEGQQSRW